MYLLLKKSSEKPQRLLTYYQVSNNIGDFNVDVFNGTELGT